MHASALPLLLFIVAFITQCANLGFGENSIMGSLAEDDSVREVLFKQIVGFQKPIYLAIDGDSDPSSELMERLGGQKAGVRKASEAAISKSERGIVVDKVTHEQGVKVWISKLSWVSSDEVTARGGYYAGNLESFDCAYTVKKENRVWKVISKSECWAS